MRCVARAHRTAPAGSDLLENGVPGLVVVGEQGVLLGAFLDRAIDIAEPDRLAKLHPRIEVFQDQPRTFARHRRPLDRHVIAVRVGDHAKPAFEFGKVLVVLSEDQRGMAIVIEGQGYLGGGFLARSSLDFLPHERGRAIRWFQRGASHAARSGKSRPNSELAPAETISARTISPMRSRLPSI